MKTALSLLGKRTKAPPISWLMEAALSRPRLISLAAGFTDNETLPVAETRALLADLLNSRTSGEPALQYGSTPGMPELRHLIGQRLLEQDAAALKEAVAEELYVPGRIVVTHGSQQLLYLVTECLCDAGDIVLVEDPTYFVFLGIVQSHGLRTRGVRREPDGLGLVHLESVLESLRRAGELPRLKLLYLVSYHQNPTGTTTSFAKKLGALELLRHYEKLAGRSIYLLEDTAYRELGFGGEPAPSALAVPRFAQRVICAGTFTKPFATGARLGFGLLPKEVLTPVLRVKGNHDFGTASFLQHLLLRALQSGIYDRHLIQVRNRYARKAGVMAGALRQHFPAAVHWREPSGGLYIWAALPRRTACDVKSRLFRRALAADVLYVPGRLCYAKDPVRRRPNHEMRLSFGSASETDIVTGVERLGQVIRETL